MDSLAAPLLILIPAAGGIVLLLFRKRPEFAQWLNLVFHFPWIFFFVKLWLLSDEQPFKSKVFSVVFEVPFISAFKSSFVLGIDGLNLPLVGLHIFLSLVTGLYCLGKPKLGAAYLFLFNILSAASVGSLLSADALVFYLFWEFMLIPMFFLIGIWGSSARAYAALKFFAFTMSASLLMLAAIVALMFRPDLPSLRWEDIAGLNLLFEGWTSFPALVFLGFLLAFLVKIPAWPLHVWLPDAHTEAPTGGSVILAGVLLKLGIYGVARWCLALFPQVGVQQELVYTMLTLGAAGIVLASFSAWQQTDIKRTIAYSSVAHLGFMIVGLFSFQLSSFQGAFFQNIAHGLSTGALFLIFGIIYDRTHSRKIEDYGGLAIAHPWLASAFVVAALASIGLPGLPGFVGELLIMSGLFFSSPAFSFVALSGVLFGAIYTLRMVGLIVFGPKSILLTEHPIILSKSEGIAVGLLICSLFYFGFGGQPLIEKFALPVSTILMDLR